MVTMESIEDGIVGTYNKIEGVLGERTAAVISTALVGSVIAGTVIAGTTAIKNNSSKSRKSKSKAGRSRDRKYISRQKHETAYQRRRRKQGKKTIGKYYKRKSKSKKGIHYTKKGQPYKILANGRARFIKKK